MPKTAHDYAEAEELLETALDRFREASRRLDGEEAKLARTCELDLHQLVNAVNKRSRKLWDEQSRKWEQANNG